MVVPMSFFNDSNLYHNLVCGQSPILRKCLFHRIRVDLYFQDCFRSQLFAYKSKYLFTVSGRWDGSSRLVEGKKWEFFPSAAFAWRLSEETIYGKHECL